MLRSGAPIKTVPLGIPILNPADILTRLPPTIQGVTDDKVREPERGRQDDEYTNYKDDKSHPSPARGVVSMA